MAVFHAETGPHEPDYLAGSVLRSLSRPVGWNASWGMVKTIILSVLTLGLAPLLVWPRRLRSLIHTERGQFEHLAEWIRLTQGPAASGRLTLVADRMRPNFLLTRLPALIGAVTAVYVVHCLHRLPMSDDMVLGSTIGFGKVPVPWPYLAQHVFGSWTLGLFAGYFLHWLQVLTYTSKVRSFVRAFNAVTAQKGVSPVPEPRGVGFGPFWFVAGVIMVPAASALWAVPMMLAGATQRRYAATALPRLHSNLADKVQDLLLVHRPAMRLPQRVALTRRCPNPKCRAELESVANFCTRCGTHVGPEVNAIA